MEPAANGGTDRGGPAEPPGLREFVETRSAALLRAGWLLTGDWNSAEDLVQTALASVWPQWSGLSQPYGAEGYVQRIMFTTFLRWRRRRWSGEISTGDLPEHGADHSFEDAAAVRSSLLAVLSSLPAQQRAVLVLRYFLDLSEAQTAEVLGCSIGSVKTHASRALSKLRSNADLAAMMTGGDQ